MVLVTFIQLEPTQDQFMLAAMPTTKVLTEPGNPFRSGSYHLWKDCDFENEEESTNSNLVKRTTFLCSTV